MSGQHDADSWIDLKGDRYTIENNEGNHSLKDGIQIHHISSALSGLQADGNGLLSGCHNKISHQKCSNIHGKCVAVDVSTKIVTAGDCPNEVIN